jgi:intein-encoded DNA endonuclease-like protein
LAWYIVGFSDGEGSFNASFKHEVNYGVGWKVALSFNISQRDEAVLKLIQAALKCGTIRFRKDGVGYFEVRCIADLQNIIVPFFTVYRLKSKKARDFEAFRQMVDMVWKKEHLTREGMKRLLEIRDPTNGGGKRKFSNDFILQHFVENPQRLYAKHLLSE